MAGGKSGRRGRLALVVLLFGGILAAGRLVPAVRWFFRQRADRVAEEVGRRGIELPTFKLTRRRALIYHLTHDPELLEAAEIYARENGISVAVAMARVEPYAREIVPSFKRLPLFPDRHSSGGLDLQISLRRQGRLGERSRGPGRERGRRRERYLRDEPQEQHRLRPAGPSDGASCRPEPRGGEWAYVWPCGRLIGGMG